MDNNIPIDSKDQKEEIKAPAKAKTPVIPASEIPETKTMNIMDILGEHPFDTDLIINPETKETQAIIYHSKTLHQTKTFSNPIDAEKWIEGECKRLLSIEENS